MTICFVCGEYPPAAHGGIGSMTQTIARGLVTAGHKARVVGCYDDTDSVRREPDQGVEVWRLPTRRGPLGWIRNRRRLFSQIATWAAEGSIDLVEVPDWQGWAALWPSLPVPLVCRLNGSATYFAAEMGGRGHWLTQRLEASSVRRADYVASVSRYTAARSVTLLGLRSVPDAILPNPVTVDPVPDWDGRYKGMVVFSGTLTAKKGVVQLVDAWNGVIARHPTARLHLFGKDGVAPTGGSMTAFLQARLPGVAASTVIFHGRQPRERVVAALRRAAVGVFPSFAEAFAIAPLESMAAGCPTISSALGSGPELVTDGDDGLTVNPRRPAAIVQAICRLLEDETLARRLGERGRSRVQHQFSIDRLLTANERFFQSCVERHGRRSDARHS
jgi:glycosyltransferase involved in cell wall biosynthesis